MPVSFLTPAQRENYGRYAAAPTKNELTRYYHLNDDDLTQIMSCKPQQRCGTFVLGGSTGMSPLAIIVSALFWTWLWGPISLLLATPLTACLVVLGLYLQIHTADGKSRLGENPV